MVHEAVVSEFLGFDGAGGKRRRTIASNAVIPTGSWLALSDPNTVALHSSDEDYCGGVASEQKKGDGEDYKTTISVYTDLIVTAYSSGAGTAGDAVMLSDTPNFVKIVPQDASGALITQLGTKVFGYLEESTSGNEQIRVRLKL